MLDGGCWRRLKPEAKPACRVEPTKTVIDAKAAIHCSKLLGLELGAWSLEPDVDGSVMDAAQKNTGKAKGEII